MCNSGPASFLDFLKTGSFGGTVWLGTQLWDAGVKKMWLDMPRKGNHVCWKGYAAPCLGIIFRSRVGGGHQTEQAFALPPWRGGAKRVAPKVKARLPGICVCAT